MNTTVSALMVGSFLLALACGTSDSDTPTGQAGKGGSAGTGGQVTGGTGGGAGTDGGTSNAGAAGAAGGGTGIVSIGTHARLSECGGFKAPERSAEPAEYCDQELLLWKHDPASKVLHIEDRRMLLNCCGDHSFKLEHDQTRNVYVATEVDAPQDGDTRCKCVCAFDMSVDGSEVPGETIKLELLRHVTDVTTTPQPIWNGELDLSKGEGSIVLDNVASEVCKGSEA